MIGLPKRWTARMIFVDLLSNLFDLHRFLASDPVTVSQCRIVGET